jgi:hypothetical protein
MVYTRTADYESGTEEARGQYWAWWIRRWSTEYGDWAWGVTNLNTGKGVGDWTWTRPEAERAIADYVERS